MITFAIGEPLWKSGRRSWVQDLTGLAMGYRDETRAFGGYWQAGFSIAGNKSEIEDWTERLGWHFTCKYRTVVRWEGFVNRITAQVGPLTYVRGPLLDVANRVYVSYSPLDTTVNPPVAGQKTNTAVENDTASQALWGIQYGIINGGTITATNATDLRSRSLRELAQPKQTEDVTGSESTPTAQVEVLGYVNLMAWPYNETAASGTIDLSDDDGTGKLQLIMADDPNSIFSTDYSYMADNTSAVANYENDDKLALNLIKSLVSLGDGTYNRYTFGIYAGRIAHYAAVPTTVKYHRSLAGFRYTYTDGREVKPWELQPGQWLKFTDFMTGKSVPADLRDDSRMEFIESVSFQAPDQVTHRGGDADTLPQMLTRMGLGGGTM